MMSGEGPAESCIVPGGIAVDPPGLPVDGLDHRRRGPERILVGRQVDRFVAHVRGPGLRAVGVPRNSSG